MTNRFQEIFRGLARRGLGYIRAQTALRAQLFRCANSLGLDKPLLAVYKRIQAAATDGPPNLPELVVKSYQAWSAHFDSPSKAIMDRLTAGADSKMPVLVIARFEKNSEKYAPVLAKKLVDSIGQNWTAVFLFGPDCNAFEAQGKLLEATDRDPRICLDASAVTQQADVVVLIQGGALPRPHGLRIFADALRNSPGALLAYSDEDHLDDGGVPTTPWFKPKFSAILTAQGVLLGRMLAFRVDGNMSEQVMQKLLCDSTDIDAFVRKFALDNGESRVLHIPHVLFHDAFALRLPIVTDWSLPDTLPKTTIVIPTRDCWNLLGPCLESLWSSDWPSDLLDVLVVDNGSTDPETLAMLGRLEFERRIRVIHDARPFNWSSLNNLAARESDGELLIFLNNDTKADDPAWLKKLAAHALRPGVGAVGCKLLYPDRTVQHGGVVAGIQGIAGHAHLFLQSDEGGYCNLANTTHEVSAVTGACLAVTRKNFELAGGFNEEFRVAFNDFVFCLTLHSLGLRNVYVADPLLIHYESKSRGADDTPEKLALQHQEARRAVAIHSALIRDDPFYSPNLSLWKPYELAFAPRRRAAWDDRSSRSLKVMMLSGTHAVRDPVAIALSLQADALVKRGYEVFVAGPQGKDDFSYPGCKRVELYDPLTAATLAADLSVDLLMAYTQPFFSTAKWTGAYPPVISYDFGEPPPDFYPDAMRGGALRAEKDHAMGLATAVYAISNAIAAESRAPVSGVIPLGNAHLGKWNEESKLRRMKVRAEFGWQELFVVLNVCDFHNEERFCRGVDVFLDVQVATLSLNPEMFDRMVFVLSGDGTRSDVRELSKRGMLVRAGLTEEELLDIYCAADAYVSFSRWEAYNQGVAKALALGLPTLASNIPAHQDFGIDLTNDVAKAADWLLQQIGRQGERKSRIWAWDAPLAQFAEVIEAVSTAN